ncbi:MAG: sugar phosphate isomerase/epimerase [Victivallales bacterium]|jgi:sugar phosphate isomerase/epimerase|nr:sugar phosphate isomerase/epimerase [Victivallales bacterium]
MQYGHAAWGLRELPLEEQFKLAKAMDVQLLELSIANGDNDFLQLNSGKKEFARVGELCTRYGVRPDCGCTGNDFTVESAIELGESLDKVKRAVDIAAEVGVKVLRIFAGFASDSVVYGERFDRMLDALQSAAAHAKGTSVQLSIETHGGVIALGDAIHHVHSISTRCDTLKTMLDALPAETVGLNFDPANLAAVGQLAPERFFTVFHNRINLVHLKDFKDVKGGIVPVGCGEGRLDWNALMKELRDYDGPALIEYELPGDVEDGLRRSLDFLKKF